MEVFTVKELANYLKCSISTVRKLVRESKIPFFKVASKINFSKVRIDEWVHEQELAQKEEV